MRRAWMMIVIAAGCGAERARPVAPAPEVGVTFAIELESAALREGTELVVTVRDPELGRCSKYDGMLTAAPCAPMPDRRETMVVPMPAVGQALTIVSTQLRVGSSYELNVAGPAADGCNRVYGTARGVVTAPTMTVRDVVLTASTARCSS